MRGTFFWGITMNRSVLLLLLLCAACSDEMAPEEDEPELVDAVFRGQVIRVEDGEGYGPTVVALFELTEFRVVDRVRSDRDGNFSFEQLEAGSYTPVVYDQDRALWRLEQPAYELGAHAEIFVELRMAPVDYYPDTPWFLEGVVRDRETLEPIPHAAVEIGAARSYPSVELFSEWGGRSGPLAQLTNEAGEFRLGPIVALSGESGIIVPYLQVSHPLYLDGERGPWELDRLPPFLTIGLDRGEDPVVIRGVVESYPDGLPQPGLAVGVDWQSGTLLPGKVAPPEVLAYTDANGAFELTGLAHGRYDIRAGLLRDDGWTPLVSHFELFAEQGDTLDLDQPILVTPAVELLAPADNDSLEQIPVFRWSSNAAAESYGLLIDRVSDFESLAVVIDLPETSWTPDAQGKAFLSVGGRFRWNLYALRGSGLEDISQSELPREFFLPKP